MTELYWIAGAGAWTYVDASFKVHARVDQVRLGDTTVYWWQTAHQCGDEASWADARHAAQAVLGQLGVLPSNRPGKPACYITIPEIKNHRRKSKLPIGPVF